MGIKFDQKNKHEEGEIVKKKMISNKINSNQNNEVLIWYGKKAKEDEIEKQTIYKMITNKTIAIKRMRIKFER